jgi:hypothetical protein
MTAALAYSPTPETYATPRPPLTLVKPERRPMPRDLRAARVLSLFVADCLSLDQRDARQLQKAFGWQPEASLRLGVRSVPSEVAALVVCSELRRMVGESDEWPAGFFVDPASNLLRFDCEKTYGLILPVWRKWPVGLMYYRHTKDERPRWITSASRETGTAAVASIHAQAMKQEPSEVERVLMLSHTLEAMAVAIRHKVSTVGFNGASVPATPAQLFESFPRLKGVVMAMKDAPPRLERELRDAGLNVTSWMGGELL